jgi:3-methyladenine DNA glycosylase/8-oxoguanine DNA glycosylase
MTSAATADPAGREFLRNADPVLARLIDARPDFRPRAWLDELPPLDAFGTLIFEVAGQQLSVSSTRAIISHLQDRFGGHLPSPAELLAADPHVLRDSGFSARKGATLRALAERFVDGRLSDEALSRMTDDEVEAALTEVPGIGPWTAHGFLLVALDRPDVFLSGDIALRRAIQKAYGIDHVPTEDEMRQLSDRWRPYRSLAVSYCSHPNTTGNHDRLGGDHRRGSARSSDGADRAARRPPRRDRQQPRPGVARVGGVGPRRWSLDGHGGRGSLGRHRRRRVPWDRVPEAVQGLNWNGQVVIDATNDWGADDLHGRTSNELVADLVAGARLVKAANTLGADVLSSDPHEAGGDRVIVISGDDADAKAEVVALFQNAGFAAIDLGDLKTGGAMQQIHHPLSGVNLIRL